MALRLTNGDRLLNSLLAPAYTIAATSRLVGLSRGRVTRYLRGYEYNSTFLEEEYRVHQPPVVRQSFENSTYASFLDLVDLMVIREFLNRRFTLQQLRPALQEITDRLETHHFARAKFFTHGKKIIMEDPKDKSLIAIQTGGQLAIKEVTESLSRKLDFEDITEHGFARRFYPRGKDGNIVIDPEVSFGRPTLTGYSVATSNIYDLYLGEGNNAAPVSDWFKIPVPLIETAVHFEHSLWA